MKCTAPCSLVALLGLAVCFLALTCLRDAAAFEPSRTSLPHRAIFVHRQSYHPATSSVKKLQSTSPGNEDGEPINGQEDAAIGERVPNDLGLEIIRGSDSNEIPDETWRELEDGAPSRLMVMKNVSARTEH